MKLARKFTLALLLGMIAILAVDAAFGLRREVELFETDMQNDHRVLGRALAAEASALWAVEGEARALEFVRVADDKRGGVSIRWVWLDAPKGQPGGPRVEPAALEPVARGGELSWVEPDDDGPGRLCSYVPVRTPDARPGAIEISESLEAERRYVLATVVRTVVTTLAIAVASSALAYVLGAWLVARPVRMLVDKARRVGAGDVSGRLELKQPDEFGELAREINAMCDRLAEAKAWTAAEAAARIRALEQVRRADRLATVGTLASGVAHELGTPLNVASERAKRIRTGEAAGEDAKENARIIFEQCGRMTKIIRQVLDFARPRAPKKSPSDLGEVVRRSLALLAPLAEKRGVALVLALPESPAVAPVDADQLQQVLVNIAMNGIQTMPQGGKLTVSVERVRTHPHGNGGEEADYVCVSLRDEGEGVPPEAQEHLFEPFFTTKDVGEGTGLGLSVSHGIVREHGGWISVESSAGTGACFSVFLPQEGTRCAVER